MRPGYSKVAVVEDDPPVLTDICKAIERAEDMELVDSATNFVSGKQLVENGGFDVLVCDLGLPDGDGTNLIKMASERQNKIDIMVLTMFADHQKVLNAIRAGARGYLLKDQPLENCVDAIREIRAGGSPISPIIARLVLKQLQPQSRPEDRLAEALSNRELETLNLLSRGFSYSESAEIMNISAHTVATYVKHIYRKLEVNSRAEAVFEASSRGILGG
ncbi:response regulator transcription factor [Parasphingorhabdus flavimaris]|jgi:DNA-binding NarL/FixJ family response regulator|uniref:Response regulator transcription factor n=1 Tax=Parasphingorhabdus flavimaris TaxID=266812 RepID=A0ABX2N1P2_9SPHN|nr:response regulator transcription factor [Parasphingorhabdus flavimaris]NVD27629.1 response regulator transcription factor [Parasphingorhabdus flavimaris]|tara:strand:+ start:6243 stop:6896 length:654 start_codon:yes stop_codon:yes gene_type:complete